MRRALLLLLVAASARAEVRYRVDLVSGAVEHRVAITATVEGAPSPLDLSVPVWTPGAWERRDWGRNVTPERAVDGEGRALALRRTGPGTFRVDGHAAGAEVSVSYRVHADLLSDDGSQVDARHAYLNGTSIFVRARGREGVAHRVQLVTAPGARVATALDGDPIEGLRAASYETLVDAPIEVGAFTEASVEAAGRSYRVALHAEGDPEPVPPRLLADLAAIATAEARLVGPPPYSRYLLLIHLADGPAKIIALEHAASASVLMPRRALSDQELYRDLLYVIAHELFHAWNARVLRPVELVPVDFDRPTPSRSLWIVEGLTEYYAHRAMRAAGLWTREGYLDHVANEMARVRLDPARQVLTLEEQTEMAWHPPDAARGDPDVWYARGHLAALGLDLALRARTGGVRSLDDVVRRLLGDANRRGGVLPVDTDLIARVADEVAREGGAKDAGLGERLAAWARRAGDPPLEAELAAAGMRLDVTLHPQRPVLGVALDGEPSSPRIAAVAPDGPAARSGIRPGDRVVGVDGARPPPGWPGATAGPAGRVTWLELVRAGRKLMVPVTYEARRDLACRLVLLPGASAAARKIRDGWLGSP